MSRKCKHFGGKWKPTSVVVVSYVPLLTGEPGRTVAVGDPGITALLRQADDCPSGHVEACLWLADGTDVMPIFMMEKAHAIADHLSEWAEGNPDEWFSLYFAERLGRYVATLFPNINRSITRFKVARIAFYEEVITARDYSVLFRPLCFVSGPKHVFGEVRDRLLDLSSVGFVDSRDVDRHEPLNLDPEAIKTIGPFPVCRNCKPSDVDIGGFVDDQIADSTTSEES